jgi:hypothetical protein
MEAYADTLNPRTVILADVFDQMFSIDVSACLNVRNLDSGNDIRVEQFAKMLSHYLRSNVFQSRTRAGTRNSVITRRVSQCNQELSFAFCHNTLARFHPMNPGMVHIMGCAV